MKTLKQLLEEAKEMNIVGRHKMNKQQLIEAIAAAQTVEVKEAKEEVDEVITEADAEEKPIKTRSKRDTRKVVLLNADNEVIEEFQSASEAIGFVVKEKYANAGWASCSLKLGRRFYQKEDGTMTKPQAKTGYHGVSCKLEYIS